jgi:hypothetical protein
VSQSEHEKKKKTDDKEASELKEKEGSMRGSLARFLYLQKPLPFTYLLVRFISTAVQDTCASEEEEEEVQQF